MWSSVIEPRSMGKACTLVVASTLALLAAFAAPQSVHAEPDPAPSPATKKHAQELFVRGVALTKENRWGDALAAFEQSSRLYQHPGTTFNLGYCERGMGRFTRARERFREALAMDAETPNKAELDDEVRDAATRYLREAEQRIGRIQLTLPEPNVKLGVDGRPLATAEGEGPAVGGTREPGPPGARPFLHAERRGRRRQTRVDPGGARWPLRTDRSARRGRQDGHRRAPVSTA